MATPILKTATPQIYDLGHRSQAMLERLAKMDVKVEVSDLQQKGLTKQVLLAQIYSELNVAQKMIEFKHLPQTADLAMMEEFNREKNFLDMQVASKIYRVILSQLIQDSLTLFTQAEEIKKLNLLLQRVRSLDSEERWQREQSFAIQETEKAQQAQIALLQAQANEKIHVFHHEIENLNKKVTEVRNQKQQLSDLYVNKMAASLVNYTTESNNKPFANTTLEERQNFARQYLHQHHKLKRELRKRDLKKSNLIQQRKELENQKRQLTKASIAKRADNKFKVLAEQQRDGRVGPLAHTFQRQQDTQALLHDDSAFRTIEEKLAGLNQKIAKIETKQEMVREKLGNLVADVAKSCEIKELMNFSYEELKHFKSDHSDLRKKMHRERATLTELNKEHKQNIKKIQIMAQNIVKACQQSDTPLPASLQENYRKIAVISATSIHTLSKHHIQK